MKAKVEPVLVTVGPSERGNPLAAACSAKAARSGTSKARWVKSGPTMTGPLAGNEQISSNS